MARGITMDIKDVKKNLNKPVRYKNQRLYIDTDYILNGCTLRLDSKGFYYQAELLDIVTRNSVIICRLEEITKMKGN